MAKGTSQKTANGSVLEFEAQLWAAARQAVPAPNYEKTENNGACCHGFRFRADLHPDLKADLVPIRKELAIPPFNMSDWGGENLLQDGICFPLSASIGERVGVRCRIHSSPVNNATTHGFNIPTPSRFLDCYG